MTQTSADQLPGGQAETPVQIPPRGWWQVAKRAHCWPRCGAPPAPPATSSARSTWPTTSGRAAVSSSGTDIGMLDMAYNPPAIGQALLRRRPTDERSASADIIP